MPDITVTWTLTDEEDAILRRIVAAANDPAETLQTYCERVGLKGIRGSIEAALHTAKERQKLAVARAFMDQTPEAQDAAMTALGLRFAQDGITLERGPGRVRAVKTTT